MPKNRKLKENKVNEMVRAFLSRTWYFVGDPIRFSIEGFLVDGQHRLRAIIKANITLPCLVLWNLPANALDVIDGGTKRSVADHIFIGGDKGGTTLGGALQIVSKIDEGNLNYDFGWHETKPWVELKSTRDRHPKLKDYVSYNNGNAMLRSLVYPTLGSALHYLFSEIDSVKGDEFFYALSNGEMSTGEKLVGSILVLRNRLTLEMSRKKTGHIHRTTQAAYIIKTWNAYVTGCDIKIIRLAKDEAFPGIYGIDLYYAKHSATLLDIVEVG